MVARLDLDPLKDDICQQWDARVPKSNILKWIREQGDPYTTCSLSTLKRTFTRWGMKWEGPKSYMDTLGPAGSEFLIALFYKGMASDPKILRNLHKRGFNITKRQLKRFRLTHGLQRRRELGDREVQDRELQEKLFAIVGNSVATCFGTRLLYTYLRVHQQEFVARDRIGEALRVVAPDEVNRRDEQANRRQRKWRPPGPNFIWSVDGYSKLDYYGIQIYACIDAYSRYIIWIYVGISAHTGVSVGRQYLNAIKETGMMPVFVRSDRGTETTLMADIHWHMRTAMDPDGPTPPFRDCWMYGKSTANQRIESWWAQLYEKVIGRWLEYFDRMRGEHSFAGDSLVDNIALLAIYMPIIREEVFQFREVWNVHLIRRQRPHHIVSGQPWDLYMNPEEFRAKEKGLQPNWDTHTHCSNQISYDLDEYLTPATMDFCEQAIRDMGCDPSTLTASDVEDDGSPHGRPVHTRIYRTLRDQIDQHMLRTGNSTPILEIPPRPRGAHRWIARAEVERFRAAEAEAQEEEEVNEPAMHFDGQWMPFGDDVLGEEGFDAESERYESYPPSYADGEDAEGV